MRSQIREFALIYAEVSIKVIVLAFFSDLDELCEQFQVLQSYRPELLTDTLIAVETWQWM